MDTIVTRFKGNSLMRNRDGNIRLKSLIPEAKNGKVVAADGSEFSIAELNGDFVVIKTGNNFSCRDIVSEKNFDSIAYGTSKDDYTSATKISASAITEDLINTICESDYQYFYHKDGSNGTSASPTPGPVVPPTSPDPTSPCAGIVPVQHCTGTTEPDGNGCPTVNVVACSAGETCYNLTHCCKEDETAPTGCSSMTEVSQTDPACPNPTYKHYESKTCECADFGSEYKTDCGEDYNKIDPQNLPDGSGTCYKCELKTCAEKFREGYELIGATEPTCKEGMEPLKQTYAGGTCYKCEGTPTCSMCYTVEMSSPTGCTYNNEEDIGTCAHCDKGEIKLDTDTCRTCVLNTATGKYEWQDKVDGDNKQTDGKCCVKGELKYDKEVGCPEPEVCENTLYSKPYNKNPKSNKQTEDTKTRCCPTKRLTTYTAKALVDPNIYGYLWKESKLYHCCNEGYLAYATSGTTKNSCCLEERLYSKDDKSTCCKAGELATDIGCCKTELTYDDNGIKKCCNSSDAQHTTMCGNFCCSSCDPSGQACGDCEMTLYKASYNARSNSQTQVTDCCTKERAIAGAINTEFHGYKWGETKLTYCCPEGYEIIGDATKTSSQCCAPEMVYTDAKGVKQCCNTKNATVFANTCCLQSRQYTDVEGNEQCCSQNLVQSTDGSMVCQTNKQECQPLTIKTSKIGKSQLIKYGKMNTKHTGWTNSYHDPDTLDIYQISKNTTITPIHDIKLTFNVEGILDMSDSYYLSDEVVDPSFVPKIKITENGKTILNRQGLNDFKGCNVTGYIQYKSSKDNYKTKRQITAKGFEVPSKDNYGNSYGEEAATVILKKGNKYKIEIDLKNQCPACVIDTACAVYSE